MLRRLLPVEYQPPSNLASRALALSGYYRLRSKISAHGQPLPDIHLYQPLYSPWLGEPCFEAVYQRIRHLTLVSRDRSYVLWETLRQAVHLDGDFVECGVYRGGTALLAAQTLVGRRPERPLHLFDSFAGMPTTTTGIDRFQARDFAGTSLPAVEQIMSPYPFVRIHAGFIPDTFAGAPAARVAWAHIDVDIYQSVRDCIAYLYPRVVPGGYLIFDDYGFPSCASARRAVDEAFNRLPEIPLCLPTGQSLVIKLP